MTLIQDILKNEKYIELMKMKKENEKLKSNFDSDKFYYRKLVSKGLGSLTNKRILTGIANKERSGYKLGLNKSGIGRYSSWTNWEDKERKGNVLLINDLSDLKKIDWKELRSNINLGSNTMERYNTVMTSLENYDVEGPMVERRIDKTITNDSGYNVYIKEILMDNGAYKIEAKFDAVDYRFSRGIGEKIHDFLILEQLYDDFRELACEFKELIIKAIKYNSVISNKLEEDIAYYSVADMI